jgi:hypothetical protein
MDCKRRPVAADKQKIAGWLERAFPSDPLSPTRKGLWFGLFNPTRHGKTAADVYVGSAPEFGLDDIDWACRLDALLPANYLESSVLSEFYSIAYESAEGLVNDAEYPLVLAYGGMAARSVLTKGTLPTALRGLCGAAVGFDGGDPCR